MYEENIFIMYNQLLEAGKSLLYQITAIILCDEQNKEKQRKKSKCQCTPDIKMINCSLK